MLLACIGELTARLQARHAWILSSSRVDKYCTNSTLFHAEAVLAILHRAVY